MIRKEFCAVTEVPEATVKQQMHKGVVPFLLAKVQAKDGTGRTWSRFTVHEAAKMIAARWLVDGGLSWQDAADMLNHGKRQDGALAPGFGPDASPTRAGSHRRPFDGASRICLIRAEWSEHPERPRFRLYEGDFAAACRGASEDVDAHNANDLLRRVELVSTVSVNLSLAYRIARERMKSLGIEPDDGRPEPAE